MRPGQEVLAWIDRAPTAWRGGEQLLPARPFSRWVNERLAELERRPDIEDPDAELARQLSNIDTRHLYRFKRQTASRRQNGHEAELPTLTFTREMVERCLRDSAVGIWEIYPGIDDEIELREAWCSSCSEQVSTDADGACLWCGGSTGEKRRPGRPRTGSRYTDAQIRVLYKAHIERGLSLNALGKLTHERVGYSNGQSAAMAISRELKLRGLEVRDRIEQVKRTCTVHGMAPKHGPRPGYNRMKKLAQGWEERPRCAGHRTQYPRKGDPCERPAMEGSRFCYQHDPAKKEARDAHLAKMRESSPTNQKARTR